MNEAMKGMAQVPAATNRPNPHCTSERCQCCCACAFTIGCANSVQAYCRLPIITMPANADHNRTHRFIVCSPRLSPVVTPSGAREIIPQPASLGNAVQRFPEVDILVNSLGIF